MQGVNGKFTNKKSLNDELRVAADSLRTGCVAEVCEKIDKSVNQAIQAWENTKTELDSLCKRYQHACKLWKKYVDSSAAIKAWANNQMTSVRDLPAKEAAKKIKVRDAKLFADIK